MGDWTDLVYQIETTETSVETILQQGEEKSQVIDLTNCLYYTGLTFYFKGKGRERRLE